MNRTVPDEALPLLAQARREVHRQFAGYVSAADLDQEALLWALGNPRKVKEYLADEDEKQGSRMLYAAVRNRLRWVAVREKAARIGYSPRDLAWYSVEQIEKELLPAVFDPEKWANPPQAEETGRISGQPDPATGGNWMAMLADVADAWSKLGDRERRILELKYRHDEKQRAIAARFEISEAAVSEQIERSIEKMHRLLGGDRPEYEEDEVRVGRRRAVSNATAQAITAKGYDGE